LRDECPNCGADLPANAHACPECGSDERTGWSEAAKNENLGLPDDSFDYDDFVEREFEGKTGKQHKLHWVWWLAAVLLVTALLYFWLGH
jgi:hypothetical protein